MEDETALATTQDELLLNKSVRTLLEENSGERIVLQDIEKSKELMSNIANKYKNLIVKKDNLKAGIAARKHIREYRYAIQNLEKHNTKTLNEAKRQDKDYCESLVNILMPIEIAIDKQIKIIEDKTEEDKRLKKEAEESRVRLLQEAIATFRNGFYHHFANCKTPEQLKEIIETIEEYKAKVEKGDFEELEFDARQQLEEIENKLPDLREKIQQAELWAEKEKVDNIKESLNETMHNISERIKKAEKDLKLESISDEISGITYDSIELSRESIHGLSSHISDIKKKLRTAVTIRKKEIKQEEVAEAKQIQEAATAKTKAADLAKREAALKEREDALTRLDEYNKHVATLKEKGQIDIDILSGTEVSELQLIDVKALVDDVIRIEKEQQTAHAKKDLAAKKEAVKKQTKSQLVMIEYHHKQIIDVVIDDGIKEVGVVGASYAMFIDRINDAYTDLQNDLFFNKDENS